MKCDVHGIENCSSKGCQLWKDKPIQETEEYKELLKSIINTIKKSGLYEKKGKRKKRN